MSTFLTVKYLGCYKGPDLPTMKEMFEHVEQVKNGEANSVSKCGSDCESKDFAFMGVMGGSGRVCMCRKRELDLIHKVDDQFCDKPCPGDRSKMCGGGVDKLSLYRVKAVDPGWRNMLFTSC